MIRCVNEEIITVAKNGKLTVLDQDLEILDSFDDPGSFTLAADIQSLAGNEAYIAFGDSGGVVRYYNRTGDKIPKVS